MAKSLVTSDTTRLNNLINHSDRNNKRFLSAIGFAVEALAKMKAPIDTGNLRNSIYTRTPNAGISNAEEELPQPDNNQVFVGPSAEYGIYLELGTSTQEAQPYMVPALREVEHRLRNNPNLARELVDE